MANRSMNNRLLRLLARCLAASCLFVAATARAEKPVDPTRPPEAWLAAQGNAQEKSDTGTDGARVAVIGKHRRFAVVDGRVVKIGDTVAEGRVAAIRPEAVVIRQGDENTALSLTPGVEKKIHHPGAAGAGKSAQQRTFSGRGE